MTSQGTEGTTAPRLLRRRTHDRVLGGVAGGLGDYFNVDPLLIRIGFVGLMIFGGAGFVLYVIAWLLLPAQGQNTSIVEGFLRAIGLTPWRIVWILAIVWGIVLVLSRPVGGPLGGGWLVPEVDGWTVVAAIVIIGGILLLRSRGAAMTQNDVVAGTPAATEAVAQPRPVRGPRSPLALYAYAAVLLVIGLLALLSQLVQLEVAPGQFFGAALVVLGIGLVVGAWWGRARILILTAVLLAPIAIAASFVTAPLEGGVGDHRFAPANAAELRGEYRLMAGRLVLDLRDLSVGAQPTHIAVSVALGQVVVILPEGASVELHARVGAGDSVVFGSGDAGTSLDSTYVRHHQFGTIYILDVQAGIGEVLVDNEGRGS